MMKGSWQLKEIKEEGGDGEPWRDKKEQEMIESFKTWQKPTVKDWLTREWDVRSNRDWRDVIKTLERGKNSLRRQN